MVVSGGGEDELPSRRCPTSTSPGVAPLKEGKRSENGTKPLFLFGPVCVAASPDHEQPPFLDG